MRVALVGAGVIAAQYAACIGDRPRLELAGATDTIPERAEELVAAHGGRAYASLAELLADGSVDTLVNLTTARWHAEVTRAGLEAGKHVYSEKPLALDAADAWALAGLARERDLRLACAPATMLGEAQQTAWKLVREGRLGRVRAVNAEANWGRIEAWHPAPETFYEVGPLGDVGIYPLAIVTSIFGPVRRVTGFATTLVPERVRLDGRPFTVTTPDTWLAALELESGVLVRLSASFSVNPGKQRGLEIHGDDASLWLPEFLRFDSPLELSGGGEEYTPVPLLGEPYEGVDWARGLAELADAIESGRPHRTSAEQAAHLVEVLDAVDRSRREGGPVELASSFDPPEPLDPGVAAVG
ncbi:MAG TPA: Gfo/Idh/MocA family oxidoreductase [Gaiellaceae bacterium]|nr:Gfo/Idh/MocA family oxidoreductase [Gaiellaceae bacterium]